jgi:hypothetical protein
MRLRVARLSSSVKPGSVRSGSASLVSIRMVRLNWAAGTARLSRPASLKSYRRRKSAIHVLGRRGPPSRLPLPAEKWKSRSSDPKPKSKIRFQL